MKFKGEALFNASAEYSSGVVIGVIAGNNQRGSARQPLPLPFVIAVTDEGANLIPNVDIEFEVSQGSGKFNNDQQSILVSTDKDGRASAQFILGPEEGFDVQRVTAKLVGTQASAGFAASGLMPGDPGQTTVSGVVLDNQDTPLPGVTVRVDGTVRQGVTDAEGQFTITEAPIGPIHLIAEGSTTTTEGEWPSLSYNIVTVPGVDNPLAAPIYMVKLDTENAVFVGPEDANVTHPDLPGFNLKVLKNSVTFPNGDNQGYISVTTVNSNKIPMPPPNAMQPQLIVTIQPSGAMFDPPAQLTLPNVDGHIPGSEIEMYSYDHDLEEFVTIGIGTVSKDGSTVTSNVGTGVIKAGWHCGSVPGGNGCAHNCKDECATCNENCVCEFDPDKEKQDQANGDCKVELCSNKIEDDNEDGEYCECKNVVEDVEEDWKKYGYLFARQQHCIAKVTCENLHELDDPDWANEVLKDFIDPYIQRQNDWNSKMTTLTCNPHILGMGLILNQLQCLDRMAGYHIQEDLQNTLNQLGCGTDYDWQWVEDRLFECAESIPFEGTFLDDPQYFWLKNKIINMGKEIILEEREKVRASCLSQ